jgi:hypothetical protein
LNLQEVVHLDYGRLSISTKGSYTSQLQKFIYLDYGRLSISTTEGYTSQLQKAIHLNYGRLSISRLFIPITEEYFSTTEAYLSYLDYRGVSILNYGMSSILSQLQKAIHINYGRLYISTTEGYLFQLLMAVYLNYLNTVYLN